MNGRCLVLGANGFIGGHVVRALLAEGYRVRVYERRPLQAALPEVEARQGWLEDEAQLTDALRGVQAVLYLSWTGYPATIGTNFALDLHANLLTAIKVMEACRRTGVERLIFASSGGTVYGEPQLLPIPETHPTRPISAHGLGKLMAEQYLAVYRQRGELASVVLRPGNAYGPYQWPGRRQGFIATALGRLAHQQPIEVWGDGSAVRDYVFVGDVARAFAQAVRYAGPAPVFNIGSGLGLSLKAVLAEIQAATDRSPEAVFLPEAAGAVQRNVLDIALAQRELGWTPRVSLAAGLAETWRWVQQTGLGWRAEGGPR